MIRSILTLPLTSEQVDPMLGLYEAEQILAECLELTDATAAEIAVATDGSNEVIVVAEWPDEAAYQRWIDHPLRDRTSPQFEQILGEDNVGAGRLYQVQDRVEKTS